MATRDPDPLCLGQLGEALAVGYDWLYDAMSDAERLAVVHVITTQAIHLYACDLMCVRDGEIVCESVRESVRGCERNCEYMHYIPRMHRY